MLASFGDVSGIEGKSSARERRPPRKAAATKAGVIKAQGIGKRVARRGESDEHERRVDGIILAGLRAIPADR
jgi:hypothetical protein